MATVGREKDRRRRIEKKKKEEGRKGLGTGEPDVVEKEHGPSRFAFKVHVARLKNPYFVGSLKEGWMVERR